MPKATNIDMETACDIEQLPPNTVMISINEEHEPLYPLKLDRASEDVLTLKFTDVTARREWMGKQVHPMLIEDAYAILAFIKKHEGKDFLVHCHAGVSRSSAVCLYLHIEHSYDLKTNFWATSNPNKHVLGSLFFAKYEKSPLSLNATKDPTTVFGQAD